MTMMIQLIIVKSTGLEPFSIVTSTRIITIHFKEECFTIVVKCMTNITDRCFLIDCRLISTRWMMISGQTEADVACTEKAEVKTAQVSSQEE